MLNPIDCTKMGLELDCLVLGWIQTAHPLIFLVYAGQKNFVKRPAMEGSTEDPSPFISPSGIIAMAIEHIHCNYRNAIINEMINEKCNYDK